MVQYLRKPTNPNRSKGLQLIIIFNPKRALATKLELKRLLNIEHNSKFMIFTTDYYADNLKNTVSVKTRSLVGILSFLATAVQIPSNDSNNREDSFFANGYLTIHTSHDPIQTPISVYFRGNYFYIDDNDDDSKRMFLLLANYYQLTAGMPGGNGGVLLTLPVGK